MGWLPGWGHHRPVSKKATNINTCLDGLKCMFLESLDVSFLVLMGPYINLDSVKVPSLLITN